MRITYLHQYFNTPDMAGGTRSYEMARRLVAAGHEVNMITSWREKDGRRGWFSTVEKGIKVHWLPVPYSNYMNYAERMQAFLHFAWGAALKAASIPADVIFATSTPLTIALPAIYAKRRLKVPMVFEVRDLWPEVPIALGVLKNPLLIAAAHRLERFAYKNAARVVVLAPGMARWVCEKGIPTHRLAIIPNGADISDFQLTDSDDLEAGHPWIKGKKLVIYVGTIGLVNGVDYVVKIAAALSRTDPATKIRFAVIGDGKFLPDVKCLARELNVLDSLIYFLGKLPKREVPRWFAKCAGSIMTYSGPEVLYRDSVANKFFDSLAAGKPVFANFRGFSSVIAVCAGAGVILPSDDIRASAELLSSHLNDELWLEKASKASFELGNRLFDRDRLAQDLERVLHDAVARRDTPSSGIVGEIFKDQWERALASR